MNPDDGWNRKLWSVYTALQNQGPCEIARVWNAGAWGIAGGLSVQEKSVQDMDEDTATIAMEAERNAINRAEIGACIRSRQTRPISGAGKTCHELGMEHVSWLLVRFLAAV